MELNIPTTSEDRYLILITLLSSIKPFSGMRRKEIEIYADLVYHWSTYPDLSSKDKNKLIFNYDVRVELATKHDMSIQSVYNTISSLKSKGFIDEDGLVEKYVNWLTMYPDVLKINFIINDGNDKNQ